MPPWPNFGFESTAWKDSRGAADDPVINRITLVCGETTLRVETRPDPRNQDRTPGREHALECLQKKSTKIPVVFGFDLVVLEREKAASTIDWGRARLLAARHPGLRERKMKKLLIIFAIATTSLANAQVVFDSVLSSTTLAYVTSASTPRTSFGFNVTNTGGGHLDTIEVGFAVIAGVTAFDMRYRIWGTTNWAATGTAPALSNLLASFTIQFTGLPGTAGAFLSSPVNVSASNFLLPTGNIGISAEFFTAGTTTYIPANGATVLFQQGTPLVGTQTDGFVRDGATTGLPSGNFLGQDLRNFGPPNDHAVLATRLTVVPEPASIAALGLGALALLRRRRTKKV